MMQLLQLHQSRTLRCGLQIRSLSPPELTSDNEFELLISQWKRWARLDRSSYHSFMCGRLDQNDIARLIADFSWVGEVVNRSQAEGSFNVAPGTYRPLMHLEDGNLCIDDLHWGYRSAWAQASGKVPMAINTRAEKIGNSYWRPLLARGRAIVPANGWYEWTGEKGAKQPWHLHRNDGSPIFIAALANFAPANEFKASNGFTVVTADADGGLLDVHDRRPVVLSAADAALWLAPDLSPQQAEQLLRSVALGPDAFDWYMVDRAVGNVRSEGPKLAEPLGEPLPDLF